MVVAPTVLIKYSEKKGAVVESAVLDSIVQFRHLQVGDTSYVVDTCDWLKVGTYT